MSSKSLTALCAAAFLAACGGADNNLDQDAVPGADQSQLSQDEIERLAERYPRLGDEPLPQPTPSAGAAPENVPRAVRRTAETVALESVSGEATFYANHFEGRRTASGIPFRQNQMVAAHRAYPFGTILRVTNLTNGKSVNVRVVDRGPFGSSAHARRTILDLSQRAAQQLDYVDAGRARVRVEVLEWGRGVGSA